VGANLYELSKGMTGYALGVAAKVNDSSLLALDIGMDNHARGLVAKPGIGVRAGSLALTYAYGMQANRDGDAPITAGNTLGIGFDLSPTARVQGYYNHFSTYYFGAILSF
jgi:hypothetical protein